MGYYSTAEGVGICYFCDELDNGSNNPDCGSCGMFVCTECHDIEGCE